jgi:hypothetical protein
MAFILVLLFVSSSFGLVWGYLSLSLSLLFAWHPPCSLYFSSSNLLPSRPLCFNGLHHHPLFCCLQDIHLVVMVFIFIFFFIAYKTPLL